MAKKYEYFISYTYEHNTERGYGNGVYQTQTNINADMIRKLEKIIANDISKDKALILYWKLMD